MTAGDDTYKGLAVPLFGNFEIKGESTTLDIMTLTQDGSGVGDFINCQTSAGTATFTVEDDGKVVGAAGMEIACLLAAAKALTIGTSLDVTAGDVTVTAGDVQITKGYYLRFTSWPSTDPTTGLTLGDIWLQKKSGLVVQLGVCVDGSNTARFLNTVSVSD